MIRPGFTVSVSFAEIYQYLKETVLTVTKQYWIMYKSVGSF